MLAGFFCSFTYLVVELKLLWSILNYEFVLLCFIGLV